MADKEATTYPEHEKLQQSRDERQTIGEFLDWLQQQGLHICIRRGVDTPWDHRCVSAADSAVSFVCNKQEPDELTEFQKLLSNLMEAECVYWPTNARIPEDLLAGYFGIDQEKLEAEKRHMLDVLRKQNESPEQAHG